jgi:hypothetical protein
MSLNDEETACSLCSFYIDHFLFRRASYRMTRTSPLPSRCFHEHMFVGLSTYVHMGWEHMFVGQITYVHFLAPILS